MSGSFNEVVMLGVRGLRRSAVAWSIGVVAFVVINLAFWPTLENSDALAAFDQMGQLLEAFGAQNIATPAGYMDGQLYALLLPLLLSAMVITIVSGLTAGDESAGRLELLHALPIDRRLVWLGRWAASMVVLLAVTIVSGVVALACLPVFSLTEVSVGRVVGATVGCGLLAALHGSMVYAAAGAGATRATAVGVGIVVLVGGYVASFVLPISDSLSSARSWSPWYWALGDQPVTNGVWTWWLALVVGLTLVFVVMGTSLINRRDIRTA